MDDGVWVPTVFSKNRDRLLEHDAMSVFFNQILEQAAAKNLLSTEHFSVDGTLIQAWAGHKSFVPKDDTDREDGGDGATVTPDPSDFKGTQRSNATHAPHRRRRHRRHRGLRHLPAKTQTYRTGLRLSKAGSGCFGLSISAAR